MKPSDLKIGEEVILHVPDSFSVKTPTVAKVEGINHDSIVVGFKNHEGESRLWCLYWDEKNNIIWSLGNYGKPIKKRETSSFNRLISLYN